MYVRPQFTLSSHLSYGGQPMASRTPNSAWYRALNLSERALAEPSEAGSRPPSAEAEKRLARWRQAPGLDAPGIFERRLTRAGLTEERFLELLTESAETTGARLRLQPGWLLDLQELLSSPHTFGDGQNMPGPMTGEDWQERLAVSLGPFLAHGREWLVNTFHEKDGERRRINRNQVGPQLLGELNGRLLGMAIRTLVLELNAARLQGELRGTSPDERFKEFAAKLARPGVVLGLLTEYPVLARQLMVGVRNWHVACQELLGRLMEDWEEIAGQLNGGRDLGTLTGIKLGAGDRHRGGRTVAICSFSSGSTIVYKPRSLGTEVRFRDLLGWLNERGAPRPFKLVNIVDRREYGWVEHVPQIPCQNRDELQRFYERQGANLALLYMLDATDIHSDNVVACGEHPVIVDLESLFHPLHRTAAAASGTSKAAELLAHSVMRIGLLPERLGITGDYEGLDLSGLGGKAGQLTPAAIPSYSEAGTDTMRLVRQRLPLPGYRNRPSLRDEDVNVLDYAEPFVRGFAGTYRLLYDQRDALLSPSGPVRAFAHEEVRVLLRSTHFYGTLLEESFHPSVLGDALSRERLFDRLWEEADHRPNLEQVIEAERRDLWDNDIPHFVTRPDEVDLWTSRHERLPAFFEKSGLQRASEKIRSLSEEDLRRQLWFARSSLATLAMSRTEPRWPSYVPQEPVSMPTSRDLVAQATAIADRIGELAVVEDGEATWFGLINVDSDRHWAIAPLGPDLYDGSAGIALFLAQLGAVSQRDRYTAWARAGLTAGLRRAEAAAESSFKLIGAFSGWGGLIYALVYLARLWRDSRLLDEAEGIAGHLSRHIDSDERWDVLSGSAGAILSLLRLYRAQPRPEVLAAAVRCGDRLLSHAEEREAGLAWSCPETQGRALAGLSHGAAGIAWALLELGEATRDTRYDAAARAAIRYERSLFSAEAGNWRDLREEGFATAWCHGAPGIGLARVQCLPMLDGDEVRREIETAVETTFRSGFGHNHCLCHGDIGNATALLTIGSRLRDQTLLARTGNVAGTIYESIQRHGWLTGVPLAIETPGLMTGLAGIGYGLLRFMDSKRIPCVLSLEVPP